MTRSDADISGVYKPRNPKDSPFHNCVENHFSCKRCHFCSSCHRKRVVEYGEWLLTDILKKIPCGHRVFGIPERLQIYFMYDRSLLGKSGKCAWKVASAFLESAVPQTTRVRERVSPYRHTDTFPISILARAPSPPTAAFFRTAHSQARQDSTPKTLRSLSSKKS